MKIQVEVSARHIHISEKDVSVLFGEDFKLTKLKELSQPFEFASNEVLDIEANGKRIKNMRIVGPEREKTQIEISKTDAVYLGINPPLRLSGDVGGSAGIKMIGPKGELELSEGVIIAKRHIHCNKNEADSLKIKNNDFVSVKIEGDRVVIFENVAVRVGDNYKLSMHIDTDEANAAGIDKIGSGIILGI
jgi:putative phosphotransacetylase